MSKAFLKRNWFILGIVTVLLAGFAAPRAGISIGGGFIGTANKVLVVWLFFLTGLGLPSETILRGLREVRLHLYIQLFVFAVYPLYFLAAVAIAGPRLEQSVVIGFYALAVLPTTVSSCIVFTQSADGNVVGAMFNAALANVAGIFLSPLILSLLVRGAGRPLPADEALGIVRNLALMMLVPVVVGQIVRIFVKSFISAHRSLRSIVANCCILLIVFFALYRAASNPEFTSSVARMAWPFVFLAVSNIVLVLLSWGGARVLRFSRESTVTVLFAAPQKTLALGVPLLTTYFANDPELLAVAMLPLLFYHPWQLFVAGVVRGLLARAQERAGQDRET